MSQTEDIYDNPFTIVMRLGKLNIDCRSQASRTLAEIYCSIFSMSSRVGSILGAMSCSVALYAQL